MSVKHWPGGRGCLHGALRLFLPHRGPVFIFRVSAWSVAFVLATPGTRFDVFLFFAFPCAKEMNFLDKWDGVSSVKVSPDEARFLRISMCFG